MSKPVLVAECSLGTVGQRVAALCRIDFAPVGGDRRPWGEITTRAAGTPELAQALHSAMSVRGVILNRLWVDSLPSPDSLHLRPRIAHVARHPRVRITHWKALVRQKTAFPTPHHGWAASRAFASRIDRPALVVIRTTRQRQGQRHHKNCATHRLHHDGTLACSNQFSNAGVLL